MKFSVKIILFREIPDDCVQGRSYVSWGDFNALGLRVERRRVYGRHRQGALRSFSSRGPGAWVVMASAGDPRQRHQGLLVEVRHLPDGRCRRCSAVYDTSCYFIVRPEADTSRLNLYTARNRQLKSGKREN